MWLARLGWNPKQQELSWVSASMVLIVSCPDCFFTEWKNSLVPQLLISLVPRLSQNANMYHKESLVSFLRMHDVIEMVLKQKGNVLCIVQPTMHSTLGVYDIQPLITRYM